LGWFCLSKPCIDAESNKVNFNVSVDTNKLEADAEKLKQEITGQVTAKVKAKTAEEITQRVNEFGNRGKSQGVR
jgi:hypothetical protein